MRKCTRCELEKPVSEFSPDRRLKSGVQSRCKACFAEMRRLAYAEDPSKQKAAVKKYYQNNPDRVHNTMKKYRSKNPDKVFVWKKNDRRKNNIRIQADNAARRAKIREGDTSETRIMYALRDFYRAMSLGEMFHVDHIIPLAKGGKHELSNLQVIPASDNLHKGAR